MAALVINDWLRASLWSAAAGYVASEQSAEALAEARRIPDRAARASALHGIGRSLPDGTRPVMQQEALTTVRQIEDDGGRAETLAMLLDNLANDQRTPLQQEAGRSKMWIRAPKR